MDIYDTFGQPSNLSEASSAGNGKFIDQGQPPDLDALVDFDVQDEIVSLQKEIAVLRLEHDRLKGESAREPGANLCSVLEKLDQERQRTSALWAAIRAVTGNDVLVQQIAEEVARKLTVAKKPTVGCQKCSQTRCCEGQTSCGSLPAEACDLVETTTEEAATKPKVGCQKSSQTRYCGSLPKESWDDLLNSFESRRKVGCQKSSQTRYCGSLPNEFFSAQSFSGFEQSQQATIAELEEKLAAGAGASSTVTGGGDATETIAAQAADKSDLRMMSAVPTALRQRQERQPPSARTDLVREGCRITKAGLSVTSRSGSVSRTREIFERRPTSTPSRTSSKPVEQHILASSVQECIQRLAPVTPKLMPKRSSEQIVGSSVQERIQRLRSASPAGISSRSLEHVSGSSVKERIRAWDRQ